jgi:hypothetical protein
VAACWRFLFHSFRVAVVRTQAAGSRITSHFCHAAIMVSWAISSASARLAPIVISSTTVLPYRWWKKEAKPSRFNCQLLRAYSSPFARISAARDMALGMSRPPIAVHLLVFPTPPSVQRDRKSARLPEPRFAVARQSAHGPLNGISTHGCGTGQERLMRKMPRCVRDWLRLPGYGWPRA